MSSWRCAEYLGTVLNPKPQAALSWPPCEIRSRGFPKKALITQRLLLGRGFRVLGYFNGLRFRPLNNNPPNRDYNQDPKVKALKGRGGY